MLFREAYRSFTDGRSVLQSVGENVANTTNAWIVNFNNGDVNNNNKTNTYYVRPVRGGA